MPDFVGQCTNPTAETASPCLDVEQFLSDMEQSRAAERQREPSTSSNDDSPNTGPSTGPSQDVTSETTTKKRREWYPDALVEVATATFWNNDFNRGYGRWVHQRDQESRREFLAGPLLRLGGLPGGAGSRAAAEGQARDLEPGISDPQRQPEGDQGRCTGGVRRARARLRPSVTVNLVCLVSAGEATVCNVFSRHDRPPLGRPLYL